MPDHEDKFSFIHFVNSYSIWVALGSFSTFCFYSRIFQVPVDYVVAVSLSLSVWIIYTLDHLFDGLGKSGELLSLRHRLHITNRNKLLFLVVISMFTVLALSLYIDRVYYYPITVLASLTVLHFLVNYFVSNDLKRKAFLKELTIAFVVTAGFCYLPSISLPTSSFSELLLLFSSLFFINLANLLAFSYYDKDFDRKTNMLSAASFTSENTMLNLIRTVVIASLGLNIVGLLIGYYGIIIALVLLAMQLTLISLTSNIQFFKRNDRYRFYGDLIYLYPMIALPFL
mgnify:FL=1